MSSKRHSSRATKCFLLIFVFEESSSRLKRDFSLASFRRIQIRLPGGNSFFSNKLIILIIFFYVVIFILFFIILIIIKSYNFVSYTLLIFFYDFIIIFFFVFIRFICLVIFCFLVVIGNRFFTMHRFGHCDVRFCIKF